ncbi:membrane protein [soil metagenome]
MLMTRRLGQLLLGLFLYGLSIALIVRADLGLDPWDVLNQGITDRSGLSFGTVVILIGAAVLLLWILLRQKPGLGTVANVVLIGVFADLGLSWIPVDLDWRIRAVLLITGVVLNGAATGAYVGAGLGPGPRDGLMTGIVRQTGWPVKWVRMGIEVAVVCVGWLLGGSVGLGTVLYALSIGPLVHVFLPLFTIRAADTAA